MSEENSDGGKVPLDEFTKIVELTIGSLNRKILEDEQTSQIMTWLYNNNHGCARLLNMNISAMQTMSL
jgi:hypothetical protein